MARCRAARAALFGAMPAPRSLVSDPGGTRKKTRRAMLRRCAHATRRSAAQQRAIGSEKMPRVQTHAHARYACAARVVTQRRARTARAAMRRHAYSVPRRVRNPDAKPLIEARVHADAMYGAAFENVDARDVTARALCCRDADAVARQRYVARHALKPRNRTRSCHCT